MAAHIGQISSPSLVAHHVYANDELEGRGSRAGEVYRIMREKLVAVHTIIYCILYIRKYLHV